jgi:hypothetical protein
MEENLTRMEDNMKSNQEEMIGSLASKMDAHQERMEAIVRSIRSERDEKIQLRKEDVTERQGIPEEGAGEARL